MHLQCPGYFRLGTQGGPAPKALCRHLLEKLHLLLSIFLVRRSPQNFDGNTKLGAQFATGGAEQTKPLAELCKKKLAADERL
jgi:hypothetical protein